MNRAVFLDRDGTINKDVGYLNNPNELVFIRGAKTGVRILKKKGFLVFVVTNQSGVARGYITLDALSRINGKLYNEFRKEGISIDGIYYCPHHPEDNCDCRKPRPKMVKDIAREYKIDLKNSFFIGDKPSDIKTGKNAGCKTVLTSKDTAVLREDSEWTAPDFIAKDLLSAARWVIWYSSSGNEKA